MIAQTIHDEASVPRFVDDGSLIAYNLCMNRHTPIQLGELCSRLDVPYRALGTSLRRDYSPRELSLTLTAVITANLLRPKPSGLQSF